MEGLRWFWFTQRHKGTKKEERTRAAARTPASPAHIPQAGVRHTRAPGKPSSCLCVFV